VSRVPDDMEECPCSVCGEFLEPDRFEQVCKDLEENETAEDDDSTIRNAMCRHCWNVENGIKEDDDDTP
jgi:hypothetical protein